MVQEKLKSVLTQIDFIGKYKALEETFHDADKDSKYIPSQSDVLEILHTRNYKPKYFKSEKFYKIADVINDTLVQLNLAFPGSGHKIECILYIEDRKNKTKDGGPFTLLIFRLTAGTYQAKKIPFADKSQLEEVIDKILAIYEEIKKHF